MSTLDLLLTFTSICYVSSDLWWLFYLPILPPPQFQLLSAGIQENLLHLDFSALVPPLTGMFGSFFGAKSFILLTGLLLCSG